MKRLSILVALVAVVAGLVAAWQLGFDPFGDVRRGVPPPLVALHEHLERNGLPNRVGLVRIETAGVQARALYTLKAQPERSFTVLWFGSGEDAATFAAERGTSSTPTVARANGPLVLQLRNTPLDDETARRLLAAFAAFDARSAAR